MRSDKTAAALWQEHRDESVVRRAEHYAKYTIPSLMVDPLLSTTDQDVIHDFQSAGAVLVNNLASKLTQLLFPTGQPFFKNRLTDELKKAAQDQGIDQSTIEARLSNLEQRATERLVSNASFAKLIRLVKLLIVTGQALVYRDAETAAFRVWTLQSFSVQRGGTGEWKCIVLKQRMDFGDLPEAMRNDTLAKHPNKYQHDTRIDFFTVIKRDIGSKSKRVTTYHEIDGKRVGSESSYPEHLSPWLLPVWNLADGEDYGRGHVEEHAGDFAKLSIVSEQLGLYEIDSLNVLNLVDESAGAVVDDFKGAEAGDYIPGKAGAVTAYERGDYNKMAVCRQSIGEVIARLSAAFMYTANTRDAERVTATEIRNMAREAENTLGGVYSVLAQSLQTPLAYLMMSEVSDELIPGLINKVYVPEIITGIPALNRNVAVQNLLTAAQEAAVVVPALQQLDSRLDPQKILDLFYRNHSVDIESLKKSPEQLAEEAKNMEAQAQQQTDLVDAGPDIQQSLTQFTG